MKQIVIQKHIRSIAKDYLKVLRQKSAARYQTPEDRLLDFERKLRKKHLPDYADYIKAIRRHYPIII